MDGKAGIRSGRPASPGSTRGFRRRSRRGALLAAALLSLLLAASALAAVGGLTQKPGTAGCISEDGTGGNCVDGTALDGAASVTVSPDGASAYVASLFSDAVAIFDRNTSTGAMTQQPGTAGCISQTGTAGACVVGSALDAPASVTVSPDGANAYATSFNSDAVTVFDRNTTTGALTQKPGTAGCISETGGACVDGIALDGALSVTVSPDGTSVYVTSITSNAVAIFDRNTTTGALTQKPGTAGCISETGTGGFCVDGIALDASSVTVSPDGTSAYVASFNSDAVAVFDRNTSTGALTQKPGTAGCISETGTGGFCGDGTALAGANSVTVSPDGASAYVASISGVAIFDRNTTTGALTQKPGTAGCISETGTAGACVVGTAVAGGNSGGNSVTVSPDGASAYVASFSSDAVAIFDRVLRPETTIDSGPSGLTNASTPSFSFSSSDGGSSFECKVDGGPFGACSGPGASDTTPALSDGSHTFAVRAVYPAANPDPTPATRAFTVDTTAPETKITKKPKKKLKTKKAMVKVKVSFTSESGATFECRLDKKPLKPCSSPFSVKARSKGGKGKKHAISVRATDEAGNGEAQAAGVQFKLIRKR